MSRRVASQVHKQASRLLRKGYLKQEPAWYQAVLDHPPLPLPPKAPPERSSYDLPTAESPRPTSHSLSHKNRPLPIYYLEDEIRRQFFQDHPFEAFRPRTLVEGAAIEDEHPIRGISWTRLRQRGRNPTPEDAIRFALNLHFYQEVALTEAYSTAVAQFRALRSEQEVAKKIALLEAEYMGIRLGPTVVDITFDKEEQALNSWTERQEVNVGQSTSKKRWKAIMEREGPPPSWTRGQEYVRLWQEGIRPTYAPLVTERKITPAGIVGVTTEKPANKPLLTEAEIKRKAADYMKIRPAL
ncbi:uncharacterized protein LAESUDRAFT_813088 [Laetiporus sulphureus 93-53]|uniref:Small ribosomal subunit protein mS23 n=1 Tax=Laetiporus sulphureus 93-53 TaxID=1314785 RepID=A0A165DXI4_9APHY|nr:uncharacterized protein LAESUDRAFT_813088 [Laetiporus sulphureus 93-53]KZT05827.1 hypothetical protein LAESUDRAFT_813088 [Laetiporus sulphureus 93-53]